MDLRFFWEGTVRSGCYACPSLTTAFWGWGVLGVNGLGGDISVSLYHVSSDDEEALQRRQSSESSSNDEKIDPPLHITIPTFQPPQHIRPRNQTYSSPTHSPTWHAYRASRLTTLSPQFRIVVDNNRCEISTNTPHCGDPRNDVREKAGQGAFGNGIATCIYHPRPALIHIQRGDK